MFFLGRVFPKFFRFGLNFDRITWHCIDNLPLKGVGPAPKTRPWKLKKAKDFSVLSLTENTHRDKSHGIFDMVCIPRQRRDIQTRYVLTHSICFCIPRQRRDMSKAKGIYLISNWRVATIYRAWAAGVPRSEEWALGVRSIAKAYRVHLSWTYFTKVNISTEEKTRARIEGFISFYSCSFCL